MKKARGRGVIVHNGERTWCDRTQWREDVV